MERISRRTAFYLFVAAAATLVLASCEPLADPSSEDPPTVFKAGYHIIGSTLTPCYWTGTTRTDLPLPASAIGAEGVSIAVEGTDIWVGGWYHDASSKRVPCIWKNGAYEYTLERVNGYGSEVASIAIHNGEIYSAGYYTDASSVEHPCYWMGKDRGGTFGSTSTVGRATGLVWAGTYIYASGYYLPSGAGSDTACFWLVADPIGAPAVSTTTDLYKAAGTMAHGSGIAMSGNTPCVAGYYTETVGENTLSRACYWLGNSDFVALAGPDSADSWEATCICISDGVILTAGNCESSTDEYFGCCWQGTSYASMGTSAASETYLMAIGAGGGSAYIAGSCKPTGNTRLVPCEWKGSKLQTLPCSSDFDAQAWGICVVE